VSANLRVIRRGHERVRAGPWRGDTEVAYLSPAPGAPLPSASLVRRCLDQLAEEGYQRVVTSALLPHEQEAFVSLGFAVEEQLLLLAHDLRVLPEAPLIETRRATMADRPQVLAVDTMSFPRFWQLDDSGLDEALSATPRARFRVAIDAAGTPYAYAITGRAGRRGYVQRLAVHPDRRRAGVARALVVDGLRWLRRWRADRALVNTQEENTAAAALYRDLGFRPEPVRLSVLGTILTA
jgi:ribosomal protein S18 acetylase RimI-like enzyme